MKNSVGMVRGISGFLAVLVLSACGSESDIKKACQAAKKAQLPQVSRGGTVELADFQKKIKSVSGGGARDCGSVGITLDPTSVNLCVMGASSSQRGFYAVIQQREEKTRTTYWEAWVRTEYPSGVVEPRILVYRQYSTGKYSVHECLHAQPSSGAATRQPFDCSAFLEQPAISEALAESQPC
ncbi:MAG: hypothetical protein JNL01_15670 [Bdellovibrionales bacterium]|nr:hypothetical protein [Bdellovibrionales bacterium]